MKLFDLNTFDRNLKSSKEVIITQLTISITIGCDLMLRRLPTSMIDHTATYRERDLT